MSHEIFLKERERENNTLIGPFLSICFQNTTGIYIEVMPATDTIILIFETITAVESFRS